MRNKWYQFGGKIDLRLVRRYQSKHLLHSITHYRRNSLNQEKPLVLRNHDRMELLMPTLMKLLSRSQNTKLPRGHCFGTRSDEFYLRLALIPTRKNTSGTVTHRIREHFWQIRIKFQSSPIVSLKRNAKTKPLIIVLVLIAMTPLRWPYNIM